MSTTTHHNAAPHGGEGHERRDIRVGTIVGWGVGVFALLFLSMIAIWPLLRFYEAREARESPRPSPLASEYGPVEPPEPRLQVDPAADIEKLRATEQAVLDGYGWVDRGQGTVRIPIDRAMTLFAERRSGGTAK
jgi:hypothetical protein